MDSTLSIDGSPPLPVRRPASVAEVGEVVRAAVAAGEGVYPVGGRTALDVGRPPALTTPPSSATKPMPMT